jgi:hypothetical protein
MIVIKVKGGQLQSIAKQYADKYALKVDNFKMKAYVTDNFRRGLHYSKTGAKTIAVIHTESNHQN